MGILSSISKEVTREDCYEAVRVALAEANSRTDQAKALLAHQYTGSAEIQAYYYEFGRAAGLARALEEIEKVDIS